MPNLITLIRILIVPFFFTTLLYYQPDQDHLRGWAFALFLTASLTDAIDGLIARIRKEITRLGRFLDPLADKLLLLSGYIGVRLASQYPLTPPLWVIVTVVFRDLVIVGGLVLLFVSGRAVEVEPTFLGKTTTALQMVTLLSILLLFPISPLLWNVTAFMTIASGLHYVIREMIRLRK